MDGMELLTSTNMEEAIIAVAIVNRADEVLAQRAQDQARLIRNEIAEALNGD